MHLTYMPAPLPHKATLRTCERDLEEAGDIGAMAIDEGAPGLEIRGAMGEETQKWWKSMAFEFYIQVR